MSAEYEWFVTPASIFRYRVELYRTTGNRRVLVDRNYFNTLWGCRRWASRLAQRERKVRANGGYVARGST